MVTISRFLTLFIQVFSWWGITTYFTSRSPSYLPFIWIGFLSSILVAIIAVVSYYYDQLLANTGPLSTAIDAFQLLSPIVCHLILIAESVLKRNLSLKMWHLFNRIERLLSLSGLELSQDNQKLFTKYVVKFFLWQLIPFGVELYIILTISKAVEWQQNWIARIFSFNAIRMASMHYILWADYLASRAAIICAEMKSLEMHTRGMKLNLKFDRFLFRKLDLTKSLHCKLWRLSQDVNERFGVFIVTTITNLFLSITVDLYWIYGNFIFGGNPFALRK